MTMNYAWDQLIFIYKCARMIYPAVPSRNWLLSWIFFVYRTLYNCVDTKNLQFKKSVGLLQVRKCKGAILESSGNSLEIGRKPSAKWRGVGRKGTHETNKPIKNVQTALKIHFYSAFALNKTEIRVPSRRSARDRLDRKENTEPRCWTKAEFILFTLFRFYLDSMHCIDEITEAFDGFRSSGFRYSYVGCCVTFRDAILLCWKLIQLANLWLTFNSLRSIRPQHVAKLDDKCNKSLYGVPAGYGWDMTTWEQSRKEQIRWHFHNGL